jgi:hypothetical protein
LGQSWQTIAVRAVSHVLALSAVALVLFVTLVPAHAQTIRVADVTPLPVPAELMAVRTQPAIGATAMPLPPGQQPLTAALLANYVERQKALRSANVFGNEAPGELTTDVLMGYIARGSIGGNSAVSAIASFTSPAAQPEPALNPHSLAAYVENGYQPLEQRPSMPMPSATAWRRPSITKPAARAKLASSQWPMSSSTAPAPASSRPPCAA